MLAPTHSVFGIFLTLVILAVFGVQWGLHWTIVIFAVLGSIIPDIDHPRSLIGRTLSFISIPLERRYGHRTFTHSLAGWAVFSVIFAALILTIAVILDFVFRVPLISWELVPRWIAAFSISYFSHLILDMFNPRGVQMFWPDAGRDVIPRNVKFRPESGSRVEIITFIILFGLMLLAFPISTLGIASSLRWLLATPGSAIEEFRTLKTHSYLDIKGVMTETREPVSGKAEILDIDNKRLVVLYNGNVYTLSDELAADITVAQVRVTKTNLPIKTKKIEFADKTRGYLLSIIPKNALVSGTVHLPEGMDLKIPPIEGRYKTVAQKGKDLVLTFASKPQIEKLALTEFFELQKKMDQAELSRLYADAEKYQAAINDNQSDNLTPLGKQLLSGGQDSNKTKIELAQLNSQLDETNVKIEELKVKIEARKFVFSGEVYIRE